jgi:hypothetical protein
MSNGKDGARPDPGTIQGNIQKNWGPGRNLKIKIFDETDHSDMEVSVNEWLAGLNMEKILGMIPQVDTFDSPKSEIYHVFVLYTEN